MASLSAAALPLPPDEAVPLADGAVAWLLAHGGTVLAPPPPPPPPPAAPASSSTSDTSSATAALRHLPPPLAALHAPVALLPRPLPSAALAQAAALAAPFGGLIDVAARSPRWLLGALGHAAEEDPFTARLAALFRASRAAGGPPQRLALALLRSD
jgi:hypothetical protein